MNSSFFKAQTHEDADSKLEAGSSYFKSQVEKKESWEDLLFIEQSAFQFSFHQPIDRDQVPRGWQDGLGGSGLRGQSPGPLEGRV